MSWQQLVLIAWFALALVINVNDMVNAETRQLRVRHLASCLISMTGIWLSANA